MVAAGIGRAEGDLGQLAKMAYRPDAAQRWRRAKVLVIDAGTDFPYPLSPPPPPRSPPTPRCSDRNMTSTSHVLISQSLLGVVGIAGMHLAYRALPLRHVSLCCIYWHTAVHAVTLRLLL